MSIVNAKWSILVFFGTNGLFILVCFGDDFLYLWEPTMGDVFLRDGTTPLNLHLSLHLDQMEMH